MRSDAVFNRADAPPHMSAKLSPRDHASAWYRQFTQLNLRVAEEGVTGSERLGRRHQEQFLLIAFVVAFYIWASRKP